MNNDYTHHITINTQYNAHQISFFALLIYTQKQQQLDVTCCTQTDSLRKTIYLFLKTFV